MKPIPIIVKTNFPQVSLEKRIEIKENIIDFLFSLVEIEKEWKNSKIKNFLFFQSCLNLLRGKEKKQNIPEEIWSNIFSFLFDKFLEKEDLFLLFDYQNNWKKKERDFSKHFFIIKKIVNRAAIWEKEKFNIFEEYLIKNFKKSYSLDMYFYRNPLHKTLKLFSVIDEYTIEMFRKEVSFNDDSINSFFQQIFNY